MAQDIATLLQELKTRGASPDVQVFQQPSGETIYLAETSSDLSPQRDTSSASFRSAVTSSSDRRCR